MSGGAALLEDAAGFVRRFLVLDREQADVVALWVVHTWAFDAATTTPYLAVASAEKRSGKSRLLEVAALLVAKPWRAITPSEAVVFRKIAADTPTLLLDEYDAIFGRKDGSTEGLRAILNAGFQAGTTVPRCVGEGSKMRVWDFSVFCPKMLAGIGELPDTVRDRSIVVRMKRRAPGERVDRFRRRDAEGVAAPIREALGDFWPGHVDALRDARPEIPAELDDRAADAWEPLLAIADLAGGDWPERARKAALALSVGHARDDDSIGVRLLADVRRVFTERGCNHMATAALIDALAEPEDSPWGDWRDGPIRPRALARLLRPYGVAAKVIRVDERTPRGFQKEQFEDAWRRYLPPPTAPNPQHAQQRLNHAGLSPIPEVQHGPSVAHNEEAANPHGQRDVADVADRNPIRGDGASGEPPQAPSEEELDYAERELERYRAKWSEDFAGRVGR